MVNDWVWNEPCCHVTVTDTRISSGSLLLSRYALMVRVKVVSVQPCPDPQSVVVHVPFPPLGSHAEEYPYTEPLVWSGGQPPDSHVSSALEVICNASTVKEGAFAAVVPY